MLEIRPTCRICGREIRDDMCYNLTGNCYHLSCFDREMKKINEFLMDDIMDELYEKQERTPRVWDHSA